MQEQAKQGERDEAEDLAPKQGENAQTAANQQGQTEEVKANERSHFFAVANSLIAAMHSQSPMLLTEKLTQREYRAVTLIYEARTAQETELGGGNISALERMRYLNEGLAALQGVLALGRSDAFPQARGHVEEIRRLIALLKQEIAQAIVAEERRKREEDDKKKQATKKGQDEANAKKVAEAETKGKK
jgi:GDP-D-mannose dehydratase